MKRDKDEPERRKAEAIRKIGNDGAVIIRSDGSISSLSLQLRPKRKPPNSAPRKYKLKTLSPDELYGYKVAEYLAGRRAERAYAWSDQEYEEMRELSRYLRKVQATKGRWAEVVDDPTTRTGFHRERPINPVVLDAMVASDFDTEFAKEQAFQAIHEMGGVDHHGDRMDPETYSEVQAFLKEGRPTPLNVPYSMPLIEDALRQYRYKPYMQGFSATEQSALILTQALQMTQGEAARYLQTKYPGTTADTIKEALRRVREKRRNLQPHIEEYRGTRRMWDTSGVYIEIKRGGRKEWKLVSEPQKKPRKRN